MGLWLGQVRVDGIVARTGVCGWDCGYIGQVCVDGIVARTGVCGWDCG